MQGYGRHTPYTSDVLGILVRGSDNTDFPDLRAIMGNVLVDRE